MKRWHAVLARLGGHTPVGRDTVVAVVLAVLGLVRIPLALTINEGTFPAPGWVVLAASVVATADIMTLAIRRRYPRTALALATVVVLAATALPAVYPPTGVGVLVCAYTMATVLPRWTTVGTLAVGSVVHALGGICSVALGGHVDLVATFWANDGTDWFNLVQASIGTYAVPGLIGLYTQASRAYTAELADRVGRLEADRELRAQAAAAAERSRIARELHDIAAHSLSAIVVQAGAADRVLEHDLPAARSALRSIRDQGRRTLTALRGLVGIMRDDRSTVDIDGVPSPQPSLSGVADLVDAARDTGMTVELTVVGGPERYLVPATDLAGYRLIQEALTNARQHAPGSTVSVVVDYQPTDLVISVRNTAGTTPPLLPAPAGGNGLLGMRERVRHSGGELTAGPTEDGGWLVRTRLPLPGPQRETR